ncbi:MAG: hypothetical protein ACREC0_04665 [Methylocella sp.]
MEAITIGKLLEAFTAGLIKTGSIKTRPVTIDDGLNAKLAALVFFL